MNKVSTVTTAGEAQENGERHTYDAKAFFRKLGVSKNSGYVAIKRGEIPSIRIGNRLLIPKTAGDRLLGK